MNMLIETLTKATAAAAHDAINRQFATLMPQFAQVLRTLAGQVWVLRMGCHEYESGVCRGVGGETGGSDRSFVAGVCFIGIRSVSRGTDCSARQRMPLFACGDLVAIDGISRPQCSEFRSDMMARAPAMSCARKFPTSLLESSGVQHLLSLPGREAMGVPQRDSPRRAMPTGPSFPLRARTLQLATIETLSVHVRECCTRCGRRPTTRTVPNVAGGLQAAGQAMERGAARDQACRFQWAAPCPIVKHAGCVCAYGGRLLVHRLQELWSHRACPRT